MALPKIKHPTFTCKLVSTNKTVKYRPFTVKEEKILLVAQLANEVDQAIEAIKQVISNCVIDPDFDVSKLATFDVELLFINLRAKSVSNILDMTLKDYEDEKEYMFEVDLDKIEVVNNPKHTNKFKIADNIGITMKYPTFEMGARVEARQQNPNDIGLLIDLIAECVDVVYEGEKLYVAGTDFTQEEILEFVYDIPPEKLDEISEFFVTFPTIEYTIKYKNSLDHERSYTLRGLSDFFT